jgi:hypothetical protein
VTVGRSLATAQALTDCKAPNFLHLKLKFSLFFWKFGEWAKAFGRMGVQHPHFLKLAPTLGSVKTSILMEIGDFTFFQILFFLNLECT